MEELEEKEREFPYDTKIKEDIIKAYRESGFISEANAARERLLELTPLSEQMWLEWLEDEPSTGLFARSLKDFYYPSVTLFYLKYFPKQNTPEHAKIFVDLTWHIRYQPLWEYYISIKTDPNEIRELYNRQFAIPMEYMEKSFQNYLSWESDPEIKIKIQEKYLDTFAKWQEESEHKTQIDLSIENSNEAALLAHLKVYLENIKDDKIKGYVLEETVQKIPKMPEIWCDYLNFAVKNKKLYKKVAKRAVRNCYWDIGLWKILLLAYERAGKPTEHIKHKALTSSLTNASDYTEFWKEYSNHIKRSNGDQLSTLEEGENWLEESMPPQHLVLKAYRAQLLKSHTLYEEIVREKGDSYALWILYLDFLIQEPDSKSTREVFRRALEYTKDYPQEIARKYKEWESSHGNLEEIIQSLTKSHMRLRRNLEPPKKQVKQQAKPIKTDNVRYTVFIRPVPLKMKETELQEVFSQVIPVKACRIVRNREGKSKGYGYIDLNSEQDIQECIRVFNGIELQGTKITVAASKPPEETKNDEFLLFVNNLPFEIEESELKEILSTYGDVSTIRIIRDLEGKCKGYAYVEFHEKEAVEHAIKVAQINIKGRNVMLLKSEKKSQNFTLHVSNLPYSITEESLSLFFKGNCKVTLPKDQKDKPRGFAFIEFEKEENAQNALEIEFPVIDGRPIVIKKCANTNPQKKKKPLNNSDFKKFLS